MAFGWDDLILGGIGLFGNLFGASKQASAADEGAKAVAAAQKYAADLQAKGNADALTFSRQQGQNAYANSEAARQGNYGMYAAAQRRLGSVGELIGAGPREIPAYVPGVDPHFDGSGPNASSPAGASANSPTGGADAVTQALLDNYKSLGVAPTGPGTGPTDIAYFTQQAKASLAAGERPLSYWLGPQGRVAQEIQKAKGGAAPVAPVGSVASYLKSTPTPYAPVPIARSLQMPGSVASYLNG